MYQYIIQPIGGRAGVGRIRCRSRGAARAKVAAAAAERKIFGTLEAEIVAGLIARLATDHPGFLFEKRRGLANAKGMRARIAVLVSLGLNVALAAALFYERRPAPEREIVAPAPGPISVASTNAAKTRVIVRRLNFTWDEVESQDYTAFIANLRAIGCPEATIRDIIVADVNQMYAQKRLTDIVTPDQQWWRSDPSRDLEQAALEKLRALDAERRALLTKLLGPDWEISSHPPLPAIPLVALNGPVLGALSAEKKLAVQNAFARSQERLQAYYDAQQRAGARVDPAELAKLKAQTRQELAALLDPTQLEEFLLRYSQNSTNLRRQLRGLDATPDEFRSIFRVTDPIDQQEQLYFAGDDPASVKRRDELEKQRDAAIQQALSPDRFQLYKLNQDPVYVEASSYAQQSGISAQNVLPLYRINSAAEQELERIRNDQTLSPDERDDLADEVQAAQESSLRQLLGPETFDRYKKAQKAR